MKRIICLLTNLLIFTQMGLSQIYMEDSTVQTIAYWENKEMQSYQFSLESFDVIGDDTINRSKIDYVVDMEILDSSSTHYDVLWSYRDFGFDLQEMDSAYFSFIEKMLSISDGSMVKYRTNEYGVFQEVTNWEDISEFYQKGADTLKSMFGNTPQISDLVDATFKIYQTRNSIETQSIKDVMQFLNFHGGIYNLGEEVSFVSKAPNALGKNRLDREIYVLLDEIFPEDNDYRIISFSEANSEQLASETVLVLKTMLPNATEEEIDKLMAEVGQLSNTIENVSVIHGSGWPLFSKEVRNTGSNQKLKVEIRTMEIL
ncbi:hypothetical protein LZF95_12785 [Algoriphagus sp. AGSA1]|uniref:hypothetical protein n=1 Tax=Algoriphagus sp. AGSA1 TaxID=2907213 RepID=UPI001F3A3B36|nr:hypothetical protein [Algoriphagus sp. AGSA1]MCE7055556.1 hypothetical protein [Algoriphagus sp. AGSA1]